MKPPGPRTRILRSLSIRATPRWSGASWYCAQLVVWALLATPLPALTVEIERMCDLTGGCAQGDFFFDHPDALNTLRFAARAFEPFTDTLLEIPSSPGWIANFDDPDSGNVSVPLANLSIPENTLILYAGGYDMPGNQVAEAGPGKADISLSRGQGVVAGPLAYDFATWGGSIAFDTMDGNSPRNWHFDTSSLPSPGQTDFLTIALHELAHVFGFGTASSFDNLISDNQFQGASTINLTGSTVSLAADKNHWATGTTSPPYADQPLSALTTSLVLGRRRLLTPLDYAALADVGWQVPTKLLGLLGDIDSDGDVDGRDFLLWQRSIGSMDPLSLGDAEGSGIVDDFDLWLWKNNFGQVSAPSPPLAIVPEPHSILLVAYSAMLALLTRRPKQ